MFQLTNEERLAIARRVVEKAAGRVPVVAGGESSLTAGITEYMVGGDMQQSFILYGGLISQVCRVMEFSVV